MASTPRCLNALLFGFALAISFTPAVAAEPQFPTLSGRVVDDANLLSQSDRAELETNLKAMNNASVSQFLASDAGRAIKSKKLFFVTAKRSDTSKFVSSRYEGIDFDALLKQMTTTCPSDTKADASR